ncbi:MAG: hypothetical protein ABFS35_21515 [Bacteroidota bacterium]
MKITTKYNIGDLVWFMDDNQAISYKVRQISIQVYIDSEEEKETVIIKYKVDGSWKDVENLYDSKEELLKSL